MSDRPCPGNLALCGHPCGCNGDNPSHYPVQHPDHGDLTKFGGCVCNASRASETKREVRSASPDLSAVEVSAQAIHDERCPGHTRYPCRGGVPNTRQLQQTNDRMSVRNIWQWVRWLYRNRRHAYRLTHDIYEIKADR